MTTDTKSVSPKEILKLRDDAQDCLSKAEHAPLTLRHTVRKLLSDLWTFIRITEGMKQYDSNHQDVADVIHGKLTDALLALMLSISEEVPAQAPVAEPKKDCPIYTAFTERFEAIENSHSVNLAVHIHEVLRHALLRPRFNSGDEYAGTDAGGNRFIAFMTIHGVFVMWRDINTSQINYFCEPAVSVGEHFNGLFKLVGKIETMDQVKKLFPVAEITNA